MMGQVIRGVIPSAIAVVLAVACTSGGDAESPSDGTTGSPAGSPPPSASNAVSIRPEASSFAVGEPIRAVVENGLSITIYVADQKTDCSILTLERDVGGIWEPVSACNEGRAPVVVELSSGSSRSITIDPRSSHLETVGGILSGSYRFRCDYSEVGGREIEASRTVVSPEFLVG
jgi:hypothetical protein